MSDYENRTAELCQQHLTNVLPREKCFAMMMTEPGVVVQENSLDLLLTIGVDENSHALSISYHQPRDRFDHGATGTFFVSFCGISKQYGLQKEEEVHALWMRAESLKSSMVNAYVIDFKIALSSITNKLTTTESK